MIESVPSRDASSPLPSSSIPLLCSLCVGEGGTTGIHEASQLTGAFIQVGATDTASGRVARPCSSGSRRDRVLRRCLILFLKEAESKSVHSELSLEAPPCGCPLVAESGKGLGWSTINELEDPSSMNQDQGSTRRTADG